MKLQKAGELEEQLRRSIDGYEKKLAKLSSQGVDVSGMSVKEATPTTVPQQPKLGLAETMDKVKGRSTPSERRRFKESSKRKQEEHGGFAKIVLALSFCLAIFAINLYHPEVLSADGVCAPVMPGTTLSEAKDFAASAPWWSPERMKVPYFQFFCGGRARISVVMESGILYLRQEEHGKSKTLHRKKASKVKINGTTVVLEEKKGTKKILAAPWTR